MKTFHDAVVIITGASSGIGYEIARLLATRATHLILSGRDCSPLREIRHSPDLDGDITLCEGDITQREVCRRLIDTAIEKHNRLDCLINCAGASMWQPAHSDGELNLLREVMAINCFAPIQCAQDALPHLKANEKGMKTIINISSVQGTIALPNHSAYAASKHALEGYFDALRLEEPDIHILNVRPTWVAGTNLSKNRLGTPTANIDQQRHAISAKTCAAMIIDAAERELPTLTIPKRYRWLGIVKILFPNVLRAQILKKVKDKQRESR